VCVPADAACPRGSRAASTACAHPIACPPGTLPAGPTGAACRPIVLLGAHGETLVDAGAWAALALGVDGGAASAELCRPLQARPLALGLAPRETAELRLRVALVVPDQDVTRVHASIGVQSAPASPEAARLASRLADLSLAGLLEPLRSLGGQATASNVEVEVRCVVSRL
jgi:hypothetical protein